MSKKDKVFRLLTSLRRHGVSDVDVLAAIEAVPREAFLPEADKNFAYEDTALPIACGQTISQPSIVGLMSQALQLTKEMRVLEIGTGSGYQAAVLAHLAGHVFTVERYRTLQDEARARLKALSLTNVSFLLGDGALGWPDEAPFDRIIVTAGSDEIPAALTHQLNPGGILVAPVGPGDDQWLVRMVKSESGGFETERLLQVRFVPLVEGVAREM